MGKHSIDTNPDGISPAPLVDARRARSRHRHPAGRRLAAAGLLTVGMIAAGTGVATAGTNVSPTLEANGGTSQTQPHSVAEAQALHADKPSDCGIQCQAPAPDQSDADTVTGLETFGPPAIFALGLIILF